MDKGKQLGSSAAHRLLKAECRFWRINDSKAAQGKLYVLTPKHGKKERVLEKVGNTGLWLMRVC